MATFPPTSDSRDRPAGLAVFARAASLLLLVVAPAAAQTLEELRSELRRGLRAVHFARSPGSLVVVADELELSGATFDFDDSFDTTLSTFTLPGQRTFRVFGDAAPELHLEGALGYARAHQHVTDLYSGQLPAIATSVDTEWTTYSGIAGVGLRFEISDSLSATPILDFGVSHLENTSDYGGPGAMTTAALADGIAFNWDALLWSAGGGGRLDWTHRLGERHEFELVARYDLRWIGTIEDDDPAQDFTTRAQVLTLRGDMTGPTGLRLLERDLDWRATLGYRRFLEGDLFGTQGVVQAGAALELDVAEALSSTRTLSLTGAVFVGGNVTGWSLGLGVSF